MKKEKSDSSDSEIQRKIEKIIVQKIANEESHTSQKEKVILSDAGKDVTFEFDFYDEKKKIIIEVYAGRDNIKGGKRDKVLRDCFKLVYAEKLIKSNCDKRIYVIDENIKQKLEGKKSWHANAIRAFGIKILFHDLKSESPLLMNELNKKRPGQQTGNVMKKIK